MSKKFRFSMQAALDQAQEERDGAARVLSERLAEAEEIRSNLRRHEAARDDRRQILARLRAESFEARSSADVAALGARDQALIDEIASWDQACEAVRGELLWAEQRVDLQRDQLAAALARLKQFERLRENQQAEFNAEQRRLEESARDEAAILRWRPPGAEGGAADR